jgi:hypothetical protein
MKEYIKLHWKVAVICLAVGILLSVGIISYFSGNKTDKVITQSDVDTKLNKQKTDLTTKFLSDKAEISKALEVAQKKISDGLKPVIKWQKADSEKKVTKALKDSDLTPDCDSAIVAQKRYSDSLVRKSVSDSIQLAECHNQKQAIDSIALTVGNAYTKQIAISDGLSKSLVKANKGKNTKWLFAGIGSLITFFILR